MTNKEKAKEIFSGNKFDCEVYGIEQNEDEIIFMLEKMAMWKDEYYKALLDLLVKSGADANIITDYVKNFYLVK